MLLKSYATLKSVTDLFNDAAFQKLDEKKLANYLKLAETQMNSIDDPVCRLQLLETIFSFLFLRASAWKDHTFGFLVQQIRNENSSSIGRQNFASEENGDDEMDEGEDQEEDNLSRQQSTSALPMAINAKLGVDQDFFVADSKSATAVISMLERTMVPLERMIPSDAAADLVARANDFKEKLTEARWRANLILSTSYLLTPTANATNNVPSNSPSLILFILSRMRAGQIEARQTEFFLKLILPNSPLRLSIPRLLTLLLALGVEDTIYEFNGRFATIVNFEVYSREGL